MAGHTEPHRYLESAATAAEAIDNIQTQEFVDENVPATGAYKYRVRAIIDLCEPSEWAVTAEEVTVTLELGNASGLTATAGSVPGIVNLSWTAAPNASVHWLAGIKQSDWTAGNYTGIIWTQTQGPSSHILSGLTSGEEYVFAVIGGRSVNGPWSSWTSLMRVTPN
ncbi:MAG: hypothetical protein J4G13_13370 [Dehalococcoidia bacterium]|nr:hypothetical protein [Dehalococcoidia bacterium]